LCYPIELKVEAIKKEENYRLSVEGQQQFTEAELKWTEDWLDVAEKKQKSIAEELCPENPIDFLNCVRYCHNNYIPHWKKFNRAGRGYFKINNNAQNCLLYDMINNIEIDLKSVLSCHNKTVIIASSVS